MGPPDRALRQWIRNYSAVDADSLLSSIDTMLFRPISALILLPAIVLLFELGRRFHARRKIATTSAAVEGAVFGLFGLLLAFTFSGAMTRYDAHRTLLIEETNDIGTAYLRLDLLAPGSQPALRQLFRDYTTSRLHLFDSAGSGVSPDSVRLQRLIWEQAVRASAAPGASPDAAKLLLPAINAMIDITATRQMRFIYTRHPSCFCCCSG